MSERQGLIRACGLRYTAGGRPLVDEVSLDLDAGCVTILVGPNGAGKSTLLKLLTGELKAAAGTIAFGGETLAAIPPWRLACRRAVMAQQTRLAFPFAAYEVVRLGLDGVGRTLTRDRREALVDACLDAAGAFGVAARDYQTLSGGEQQRVQFARVLCQLEAGRPSAERRQALFLDEPIASLDLCHQLALLDQARMIAGRGVAVLIVLHDLNLAMTYADRLVVMDQGRIVANGPPAVALDDALLRQVFKVDLHLNHIPAPGMAFLLPQQHRAQA